MLNKLLKISIYFDYQLKDAISINLASILEKI